jgi:hypothetical protein
MTSIRKFGRAKYALMMACILAFSAPLRAQLKPAASVPDLGRQFANPPDDARPMVRWWWFGPAVTHDELERELRTMKQGGFGGVEVQPVYPLALDDPAAGIRNLPYLSGEFLEALRFTAHATHELGLRMDLTLGSGWPYGGATVPVSDAAAMLRIVRAKPDASSQRILVPALADGEQLIAAFASSPSGFHEVGTNPDHTVALSARAAPSEIIFFISSRTGQQVKRAAVGAEGFVLNHYDAQALDRYLRNVADRLLQALDQQRPYAVFCDSLEVYSSDWTPDFLQEFQRRRGYDLRPYLPALVADIGPKTLDIRYDWARTLTELFNQRFAAPLHDWARRNGTRLRMQAYGMPPATISSYSQVDLPEGEGAQWQQLSATRWASSASHIYGVPVTSSETWTWLHSPVFRATPLDMKAEADRHFLEGINQLVGHGWPYTPPGVAYPGWRFYAAAVLDEKNPWWIVMPDITRYLQRVSFLLRQGSPANDVAVYLPGSDAYARMQPRNVNLFETLRDAVGPNLVGRILESGYGLDFFDDGALLDAGKLDARSLALGANHYRVVVLPGVERIPLDSYRKLEEFAKSGGILVATRRLPDLAPGYRATDADSAEVRRISQELFEGANSPAHLIKDETQLDAQLHAWLPPDVSFGPAAAGVGFVHRHTADAEIYFVANTGNQPQTTTAKFRVGGMRPQWWNPISGDVSDANVVASDATSVSVALDLAPYESRVVVFSSGKIMSPQPSTKAEKLSEPTAAPVDLGGGWRVSFGGNGIVSEMPKLHSWTDDDFSRYFSGVARYEKSFSLSNTVIRGAGSLVLDFGAGTPVAPQPLRSGMQAWFDPPIREAAVIYVNDQHAGSLWCPPYRLDVTKFVHAGENRLRIEVANLALNAMAGQPLPDYRLLNLRYGIRFEAQDMDKVRPVPAGLLGVVKLITRKR